MAIKKQGFSFTGGVPIKVSAKSARLNFLECGPACIDKGCIAKCCDAPTREEGMLVTVLKDEQQGVFHEGMKQGFRPAFKDDLLQPKQGTRGCPFKGADHLCTLHNTPNKPFGCIVSPFMLNTKGTLTVRNRYKMLPCYDREKGKPAYKVFESSLRLLFSDEAIVRLLRHLNRGGGDIFLDVTVDVYKKLKSREMHLAHKRLK